MNVVSVPAGFAVDIPYETTGLSAALLQGAYGSNKDVRDHSFGEATATLYQIATIVDVGNQLLRASEGAAEANVRRRLGKYMGLAEGNFIVNGTGTNQPLGILQAILAYGDIAAHKYTLNSESRVAALGQGLGKLEARGERASGIVMHPTDYWEMAIETLGSSGSGGWAFDAATGPRSAPVVTAWGVPVYRDVNLPVGTALAGAWADCDIYIGSEFRIDVSSEAGSRFDQNITGFRAEEEFGFNASRSRDRQVREDPRFVVVGAFGAGSAYRPPRHSSVPSCHTPGSYQARDVIGPDTLRLGSRPRRSADIRRVETAGTIATQARRLGWTVPAQCQQSRSRHNWCALQRPVQIGHADNHRPTLKGRRGIPVLSGELAEDRPVPQRTLHFNCGFNPF